MGVAMNIAKCDTSCNKEDAVLGTYGVAFRLGEGGQGRSSEIKDT